MFDRLKEMVQVVSKNKVQRVEIIGDASNYNTLVHQLYKGIQEGKFKSADEAAQELYDSDSSNKNYKHLEFSLEQRLLNTIFFIDVQKPSFTEFTRAYYTCYKNLAATHILKGRTASKSAISLSERTLRRAIEFGFTEIVISLARHLRFEYSNRQKNAQKFEYYEQLLKKYMQIWQAEEFAEGCYAKIELYSSLKKITRDELIEKSKKYTEQLLKLFPYNHSYAFRISAYMVLIGHFELTNNYSKIISTSYDAIAFFESQQKIASKNAIGVFLFKLATTNIICQNYDEAEKAIKRCLDLFQKEGFNWYLIMRQYFLLCMHSKDYQKAYDILVIVQNTKNLKRISAHEQELWGINAAYIEYFIRSGEIETVPVGDLELKPFRYYKFLNEFPFYSKQKRGINIPILIIQILFLLQAKKYDEVIDRATNLHQYCSKYLRKDNTYRSNCFIKMLIKLVEAQFHKNGAQRKAQAYYEKLKNNPLEKTLDMNLVEIVPYEQLWEYTLSMVDNKFIRTKVKNTIK